MVLLKVKGSAIAFNLKESGEVGIGANIVNRSKSYHIKNVFFLFLSQANKFLLMTLGLKFNMIGRI